MDQQLKIKAENAFLKAFHHQPAFVASAPGRINLIGEHTDYSNGFVLPAAIDLGVLLVMSPRKDDKVIVNSLGYAETESFSLNDLSKTSGGWVEYIKGVAWALQQKGHSLQGWEGVMAGTIPIGAGLSSSAAFEMACVSAFSQASGLTLTPKAAAEAGRMAENQWVGVQVGIMDQLISAAGKQGTAILLDCQSLDYEYIPVPQEISIIVLDTGTRRELSQSAYNARQLEIQEATKFLTLPSLRDGTLAILEKANASMPEVLYQRAKHVITENERVLLFCSAMKNGDLASIGQLLLQSHTSLRDDFDVSSPELNTIVEIAQSQPGCYGARMTGAGFGGCALALVAKESTSTFIDTVSGDYSSQTRIQPQIYAVQTADGATITNL
jgi:galactokinase